MLDLLVTYMVEYGLGRLTSGLDQRRAASWIDLGGGAAATSRIVLTPQAQVAQRPFWMIVGALPGSGTMLDPVPVLYGQRIKLRLPRDQYELGVVFLDRNTALRAKPRLLAVGSVHEHVIGTGVHRRELIGHHPVEADLREIRASTPVAENLPFLLPGPTRPAMRRNWQGEDADPVTVAAVRLPVPDRPQTWTRPGTVRRRAEPPVLPTAPHAGLPPRAALNGERHVPAGDPRCAAAEPNGSRCQDEASGAGLCGRHQTDLYTGRGLTWHCCGRRSPGAPVPRAFRSGDGRCLAAGLIGVRCTLAAERYGVCSIHRSASRRGEAVWHDTGQPIKFNKDPA